METRRSSSSKRAYGAGVAILAVFAGMGLFVGVTSQIVLWGDQSDFIMAELYRPLIIPCAIALVAAAGAAVAWWLAFVKERTSPAAIVPGLAVAAVALLAAIALQGPSEVQLERRWTDRLESLHLPAGFTPLTRPDSSGEFSVIQRWATDQTPEQACPVLRAALQAWWGSTVSAGTGDLCYLYATDGDDSMSAAFGYPSPDETGPRTVGIISLSYATA